MRDCGGSEAAEVVAAFEHGDDAPAGVARGDSRDNAREVGEVFVVEED